MNRYRIDGANRRTMTAGKGAIAADNGLIPLHGYRFRWTDTDTKTAPDAFVGLYHR
jgi:hypothetical protein